MNKLLSLFRPPRLHPFERRALAAIGAKVTASAGARLATQVDAVDRIERLANGKEVNLYSKRWAPASRGDEDRFPDRASEAPFAAAWMTRAGSSARLKVEAWLANGHLFSLGFARAPEAFFGSGQLDAVDADVVDVAIWRDPMAPTDDATDASRLSSRAIPPWIDAAVPSDFARVLESSMDATSADWCVLRPDAIRKVFLPTANYYILAERTAPPAGALALCEGETSPMLHWINYETQAIRSLGTSLLEALRLAGARPS